MVGEPSLAAKADDWRVSEPLVTLHVPEAAPSAGMRGIVFPDACESLPRSTTYARTYYGDICGVTLVWLATVPVVANASACRWRSYIRGRRPRHPCTKARLLKQKLSTLARKAVHALV